MGSGERARALVLVAAAALALTAMIVTSSASAEHSKVQRATVVSSSRPSKGASSDGVLVTARRTSVSDAVVHDWRAAVAYFRQKAWNVQHRIPVPLTPTNYSERRTRSVAYLHWLKHRWNVRWHKAQRHLRSLRLPMTNDWQTAVRIVQRAWPGTSGFLLNCSAAEGGHGLWIWNGGAHYGQPHYGSDAGGWMQFMPGTFSGNYHNAQAAARSLHLPMPGATAFNARAGVWRESPLAQAFAAGWARTMYAQGNYPGPWPWKGDPACS